MPSVIMVYPSALVRNSTSSHAARLLRRVVAEHDEAGAGEGRLGVAMRRSSGIPSLRSSNLPSAACSRVTGYRRADDEHAEVAGGEVASASSSATAGCSPSTVSAWIASMPAIGLVGVDRDVPLLIDGRPAGRC